MNIFGFRDSKQTKIQIKDVNLGSSDWHFTALSESNSFLTPREEVQEWKIKNQKEQK